MPGRPCTPEARAANDPASAEADGHRHRVGLGVDQSGYLGLLRFFGSLALAALHASVSRRAALYGFHRQRVSIRPSRTKAAEAGPEPISGALGSGTIRTVRIGSFVKMSSATVPPCPRRKCRLAVLNRCFDVSMQGTLTSR